MNTPSPDRDTLLDFLQGKLPDAESEQIAQMVEDDPDLQKRLEELDHADDTFIGLLREDHEDTPVEGYTDCNDALEEAKKLFQNNPRQILGEYELLERIGQGGMGVVFKARHLKLGRTVAVKVISDARAGDQRAIARFEREIKAIGQLDHPSIVHAHDAREIDGRSILVMEYVDGMDLGRLIRRHGPIGTADACELIRQTAIGLQAAHELGLVHRDIKPSNLMLDRQGNLKILDLGLAREATDLQELQREVSMSFDLTQTGQAMGTADYMAPEQADRPDRVDIRADIYSTGCTLFKLLTGRAPYHEEMTFDKLSAHAEQPLPSTPDLPEPLRTILDRMTAKDPADRFSTPTEVVDALAPFCTGHDLKTLLTRAESQTAPVRTLPRPASGGRFRRVIAILLLVAFTGGFGLFAGIMLTIHHNGKETQLEIPDGAQTKIDDKGNVAINLDKETPHEEPLSENEKERQNLLGTWQVVEGQVGGVVLSKEYIDRAQMNIVISDRFIINRLLDGKEFKMPYQLDTTTTPKRIRGNHGGVYAIYKLEGDRLTLCGADKPKDGNPTKFVSEPNSPNYRLLVYEKAKTAPVTSSSKHAGTNPAANNGNDVPLEGVWKLVERPNREGCLVFGGGKEKTPEVTATFTGGKFYLRGDEIVNRQFSYEISPDRKNINLLDGRDQVYRGVLNFEQEGKRLILTCSKKDRPAGSWEYFGTDYDRLVFEKTDTKPNPETVTFDKSLLKTWFLMSTNPPLPAPNDLSIPSNSLARRFIVADTNDSLFYMASATFSENGHLVFDKSPILGLPESTWPKRFACDVDPSAKPKRLDVAMDDKTIFKGIYKTEGNRLYLRFATKNHARPKDFESPINNDFVELEFASSTAPTPELATVLFTRDGETVFDGRYIASPPFQSATSVVDHLKKHPTTKVVLDSPCRTTSLINFQRALFNAGVKSVQIKTGDLPYSCSEPISLCRVKYLSEIYDVTANQRRILDQQLPKPCAINRDSSNENRIMYRNNGGPTLRDVNDDPISGTLLSVQDVLIQFNTIRVKLDPQLIGYLNDKQLKKQDGSNLNPAIKVAVVINGDPNLIIAVTTLGTLQEGSFDIDYQLTDEERKILIHTLKSAKKRQNFGGGGGFGGGGMSGGGMF